MVAPRNEKINIPIVISFESIPVSFFLKKQYITAHVPHRISAITMANNPPDTVIIPNICPYIVLINPKSPFFVNKYVTFPK